MGVSTFLHDNQPTQLRGLAFLALSETGWGLRGTFVSDGGGGGTATYVPGGTVSCRLDPIGQRAGDEQVIGDRLDERSTHKVTVPPTADILNVDRFEIAGRGVFEVTAVRHRTDEPVKVFEVVSAS